MSGWTFKPRRVTLVANVATSVTPPTNCEAVEIGNGTPDDLRVYEDPTDETTYFIVPSGFNKEVKLGQHRFDPTVVAFSLKAVQAGTAVLIWK